MTKNINFVSHKKSKLKTNDGKPQLPSSSALVEGEIAINYAEDVETLSIKNESGDIVTFSSDNYYTEKKLGSGFTGENSAVTVTDTILWVSGTGVNSAVLKGGNNTASGVCSVAEGQLTKASGIASHAEGFSTTASGDDSHAEGSQTSATTYEAHSEGGRTLASGSYSHAEGADTIASGDYGSHAEGEQTTASGNSSHAEGGNTTASGDRSHAEGYNTTASGNCSHAEGGYSKANGFYSHAEGSNTKANGNSSHAEGIQAQALGDYSHAEGQGTIASGYSSHAEGSYTTASGYSSHAEGSNTTASGNSSHAEGSNTIANNRSEHASGQYNVSNSASTTFGDSGNTLFSVGNGTAQNARHNAFEIRQNGDIYIVSGNSDIRLQDYIGVNIEIDQVIDSGTSASTNAVATKAVYDKIVEDEQVWAISLNELNNNKFGYANFDSTNRTINFYKNEDDYTSGGTAINSVDLSDISIDIDQVIDSGTSASTDAVSTSAVYDFVTSYTPSIIVDQVLDDTTSASTNPVSTKAVYKVVTDNELVLTNTFIALSGAVSSHTENTDIHVTAADKTAWNAKLDASAYTPTDLSNYYTKSETSGATELSTEFELYTKKADVDQAINSTTSASTGAVSTSAVYSALTELNEVEVNSGDTPTSNSVELWVDESIDPVTVEVYTKAETNTLLAAKADEATTLNGYGITDAYTKTEVDTMMTTATEQSTINATDYVVLKDTDGVNRKISKTNMMSVVKDALADLLKSNDLGTDVTNVPVLNASAFGSATISNLASVLGVSTIHHLAQTPSNPINFSDLTTYGVYTMTGTYANDYPPGGQYGYYVVEVVGTTDYNGLIQRATITRLSGALNGDTWQRIYYLSYGWSSWRKISFE